MNDLAVLKDFVTAFEKEPTDARAGEVMFYLTILMGCEEKAPVPLMNVTRIALDFNPDTEIEDVFDDSPYPEDHIIVVESEDGRRWFPIFTDRKELNGTEKTNVVREVPIRSILEEAIKAEVIDGIMINPETNAFAIVKEALPFLLEKADELGEIKDCGVDVRPVSSDNKRKTGRGKKK